MDLSMNEAQHGIAVERFRSLAGVAEAEAEVLVSAALEGAVAQALETMAGNGPVPSSLTTARAELAQFVCLAANRILEQRETEVLFRATATTARSILTTMRATYEEALREQFLNRMNKDAQVRASGSDEQGLTWRLTFSESQTFELARSELLKADLAPFIRDENSSRRSIEIDRVTSDHQSTLAVLGIQEPHP